MANDNRLFPVPCYNGTMLTKDYYNDFFELGQQKINFSFFELGLPDDDPVYTLKNVMEELNFSGLLACYSDKGRSGYNPIMMNPTGLFHFWLSRVKKRYFPTAPCHLHLCRFCP